VGAQLADAGVFNMAHLCASSRSLHLRSDPHDDEGCNRLVLGCAANGACAFRRVKTAS